MNTNNITPIRPMTSQQDKNITLDGVIEALDAWRSTRKRANEKMPDSIWDQIFSLLNFIPESKVLRVLCIARAQLEKERQNRQIASAEDTVETPNNEPSVDFCEVNQKKSEIPLSYTPAKAFTTTTSVVEIRRPDGMLMKIHLCTDRFEELLSAFFKG